MKNFFQNLSNIIIKAKIKNFEGIKGQKIKNQ